MKKIDLNDYVDLKYLKSTENGHYIDPIIIKTIVEDCLELNMSFEEVHELVKNAKITLTIKDIEKQLHKKMCEEHPELKQYAISQANNEYFTSTLDSKEEIEQLDLLTKAEKYMFKPIIFKYYTNYIEILKQKCLSLFELYYGLYKLSKKEVVSPEILNQVKQFDLHLNGVGNLHYDDVVRLSATMIYNLHDLSVKLAEANSYETYLNNVSIKDILYFDQLLPNEKYPSPELQELDSFDNSPQFIPYTKKQEKLLLKKKMTNLKKLFDKVDN